MPAFTLRRIQRAPLPALAVLLFAAVLAGVLCGLHAFNEEERRSYEETWRTIPVEIRVTNLSGTRTDDLEAPGWVADVFVGSRGVGRGLSEYMKDLQIKSTRAIQNGEELGAAWLVGLTSSRTEKSLWPENGGEIVWSDGYDESVFLGEEAVCLAPAGLTRDWDMVEPGQQLDLYFAYEGRDVQGMEGFWEYELRLTVVGTYSGGRGDALYCPYDVVDLVYRRLQQNRVVDSVSATLIDNDLLDELTAGRDTWFAEPNAGGTKTEWGHLGYDHYPYALDINDDLLKNAMATLENSMLINYICTALIFVLSAGAGAFIGFLTIRQRRWEIALMRTLGTRNSSIYAGYALEQMLCVALGAAVGGAAYGWQPVERLGIFIGVYFVSLTIALVILLRQDLLTTIKEEE